MSSEIFSTVHMRVLNSLNDQAFDVDGKNYRFLIEEKGGRLDIPRDDLTSPNKQPGQRKKNLSYVDAVLIDEARKPRMFVEIVDSSPGDPNGITGLVINADRVAQFYPGVDLMFIVLGELKEYWCQECQAGHRISTSSYHSHFSGSWSKIKVSKPEDILHEGVPMNYRKALKDYPLAPYLKALRPPSVLFLNRSQVDGSWSTYQARAKKLITNHLVGRIGSADRDSLIFDQIEALFPASVGGRTANISGEGGEV